MDHAKYEDEALVVLSVAEESGHSQNVPVTGPVERRVLLSSNKPSMKIGRTSKRKAELEPATGNCYFDCPVMSREHAMLHLDAQHHRILVKDSKSLHGTFLNGEPVESDEGLQIKRGDMLTFGVTVDRGATKFYPFQVQADITFGTESRSQPEAVTFRVPDESEIEDISSDDSVGDTLVYSRRVLRKNNIRPAQDWSEKAIDLTVNDEGQQALSSNNQQPKNTVDGDLTVDWTSRQDDYVDLTQSFDGDALSQPRGTLTDGTSQVKESSFKAIGVAEIDDFGDDFGEEEDEEGEDEEEYDNDWAENESLGDVSISSGSPSNSEQLPDVQGLTASHEWPEVSELEAHKFPSGTYSPSTLFPIAYEANALANLDEAENSATGPSFFTLDTVALTTDFPPLVHDNENPSNQPQFTTDPENSFQKQATPSVPVQDDVTSLGLKTGKIEYFQAREENKKKAAAANYESPYAELELLPSLDNYPTNPAMDAPPLVASSLRFLNSPIPGVAPDPISEDDDGLDESSAYNFEMSKKAIRASRSDNSKDRENVVQGEEATHQWTDPPIVPLTNKSSKRKADDMSKLTPEEEEEAAEDQVTSDVSPIRLVRPVTAPNSNSPRRCRVIRASHREGTRPTKRLRRAAEVFGYVALGGVAVMSALIATAPAL